MSKSRVPTILAVALAAASGIAHAQEAPASSPLEQALAEVDAGRLGAAIAVLEPLRGDPTVEPRVPALLGALYVEAQRFDDALAVLQPLADREDADPAVLYNIGRAAAATGKAQQAETYFERSLAISPGSPAARELGLVRGRQRRFREAYSLLVPWARRNPGDFEARLAGALCAVQLERLPVAEELLSDLPQDQPQVRLLWGRVLLRTGDPWGAITTLKPLLESAPEDMQLDARRALAEAYVVAGEASSAVPLLEGRVNGPAVALELAQAHYQSGDLAAARATLAPFADAALAAGKPVGPGEATRAARVLLGYGRFLAGGGEHEQALPYLERANELDPSDRQSWQALGQSLAAVERTAEAEEALKRFREMAEAQTRTSAMQLEADLKDPTGREIRRGFELIREGSAAGALELARQEAELAPDDPRPRLLEAWSLLHLDRPSEALAAAARAQQADPASADAAYLTGVARMGLGDNETAESDLRRALELSPEHTAAMNDLAVLLMERGDDDEARRLLQRVLEIQPEDPVAADNLEKLAN